jgi:hypothetical protein
VTGIQIVPRSAAAGGTSTSFGVLAIDPGTTRSAWLILSAGRPYAFGILDNEQLLEELRDGLGNSCHVAIEKIESYGMAVGAEVFETVRWAGRFEEAVWPSPVRWIPRRAVKLALCASPKANDSNIRQALIDRFGGSAAVGRKAAPGPLYGISKDVWSALGVACTCVDQLAGGTGA